MNANRIVPPGAFGGAQHVVSRLMRESLVDRLTIFRSSLVLGEAAPRAFDFAPVGFGTSLSRFRLVAERRFGDDVMTTYALHELSCLPD